jgi:UDP-N-acetylglucosamine 2-epimerase (non-hydrolysing)/UDP-GlcNAc3NAcA epimerase
VKVLTVVGNRPQFVKSAPVSVGFLLTGIDEVVVHTGQHYDVSLSEVFIDRLGLKTADPDVMMPAIEAVIRRESPDLVLVYGDTNSTLAGARAAAQASVPVAHVEAGLRSGDMSMPEEHARIEVDRIAWLLFCPNDRARATLTREGVLGQAHVVGDVMAEASARFAPIARERFPIPFEPQSYVVATVHRQANVYQPRLGRIIDGLNRLDERVVFPAHPRTMAQIRAERIELAEQVHMTEPLSYLELASLASQARVIATDSGGLQKEAYWYGVPCVTLRPSTEWVDTVEVGANVLVDDDPDTIVLAVKHARMPERRPQLYGDGRASGRIAGVLLATIPGR